MAMFHHSSPSTVFSDTEVTWTGSASRCGPSLEVLWFSRSAAVESGEAGPPSVRNSFSAVPRNRQTGQEIAVSVIRFLDDHKPECTDSSGCGARNPGGSLQRGRNLSTA